MYITGTRSMRKFMLGTVFLNCKTIPHRFVDRSVCLEHRHTGVPSQSHDLYKRLVDFWTHFRWQFGVKISTGRTELPHIAIKELAYC